jgi:aspartate carbamoyltransferase catalytic subunit
MDKSTLEFAKKDVTIMHPLPRVNEVKEEIDELPNAAYFRQAANGLPVRMAILYLLLGE